MSNLVVIAYPDVNRAEQVLETLGQMRTAQLIDLDDAVYVTKDASGKVKLHQAVNLTGAGAGYGALWGGLWGLLLGALILQPIAGAAIGAGVGAGTGAVAGSLSDYGIDDNFMKQLGATLTANSSAIFVLVRRVTADKVIPEVSKYGGKVLQSSLSEDAEARLQAALSQSAPSQHAPSQDAPGATPAL
ncbi:MAG TPA: DUF1269 domain-containing protein [Ktedonobacterales bacterium]|jgi:uncharacterized membrane protein